MNSVNPSQRLRAERKQAALYLAHILATDVTDDGFDMIRFVSACGTVGCMAGHLAMRAPRHIQLAYIAELTDKDRERVEEAAKRFRYTAEEKHHAALSMVAYPLARDNMRLEAEEASDLFLMLDAKLTKREAIATLRRLARTDWVEWKHRRRHV